MKYLRSLFLMTLLLVLTGHPPAHARSSEASLNPQNQMELNEKACSAYKKADAEMNRIYQRILREGRADRVFAQKMRVAQRAWLVFRDAHLASLYPAADKRAAYGTVNPMCQCMELEKITDDRTKVLQRWVDGIEEGDVCGGSIKVKE
jgi:uncharacterized protein YecT (DUF1311 family)